MATEEGIPAEELLEERERNAEAWDSAAERWRRESTEWGFVFRKIAQGRNPSIAHLSRLLVDPGIPEWATEEEKGAVYRILNEGPGVKSFRKPADWQMFGRFRADQPGPLMDLTHLWADLREHTQSTPRPGPAGRIRETIETESLLPLGPDDPDRIEVEVELWWNESRGMWQVARPKEQAREIVAKRYDVPAETLKDWEREFRDSTDWLGQVF